MGSLKRKLVVPVEWVDDHEWSVIEGAFHALASDQAHDRVDRPGGLSSAPDLCHHSFSTCQSTVPCVSESLTQQSDDQGFDSEVGHPWRTLGASGPAPPRRLCGCGKSGTVPDKFCTSATHRFSPAYIPASPEQKLIVTPCASSQGMIVPESVESTVRRAKPGTEEPATQHSGGKIGRGRVRLDNSVPSLHQTAYVYFPQPQPGLPWGIRPSSCVGAVKHKLPPLQFFGKIVYSKTELEVNLATIELWQRVRELQETREHAVPIGFDVEWKTTFQRGELPRKVAVLQLCLDGRRCDVMHIIHSGIPPSLQSLLEESSTLKVGVAVHADAAKLREDYHVVTNDLVDLRIVANKKMSNFKHWSLSSLAQELTGKQIEKLQSIRCGDWEASPLSKPQLQYAATDAYASMHLYQVLQSFPDPASEHNHGCINGNKPDMEEIPA